MAEDIFWPDTMNTLLSNSIDSSIEAPKSVLMSLGVYLSIRGHKIVKFEERHPDTMNIHPRGQMTR